MDFGKKLKYILEFEDIKQKDFANVLHLSPSTLNGYLNYGRQPDFEIVKRMAAVLRVSTDYLLDYNSKENEPPISMRELAHLTNLRALDKDDREIIYKLTEKIAKK
ncbi:MAG: helix-turn-helix domain-containing protein [Lachnospiraceae bacterium]|nr:helix-turn-helix domain-containing protein [Ruminococcus sp.]MCM1274725.1 helix-turn-helix domain-containing protein [Lachnospiraceae bacterium]